MSVAATQPRTVVERAPMRAPWLRVALYALRRRQRAVLARGLPLGALAATVIAIFPSISASPQLSELIHCFGVCPDNAVLKLEPAGAYANAIDLDYCKAAGSVLRSARPERSR